MSTTTIFQTNRSQAVRLPKDVAFPDSVKQVRIIRDGKRRIKQAFPGIGCSGHEPMIRSLR